MWTDPDPVAMVAAAGIVQLPTAAIVVALPTIHAGSTAPLTGAAEAEPALA